MMSLKMTVFRSCLGVFGASLLVVGCGSESSKKSSENVRSVSPASSEVEKSPDEKAKEVKPQGQEGKDPGVGGILKNLTTNFKSSPIQQIKDVAGLASKPETIRKDLMEAFCIHAYKLPLQDPENKFEAELGVLCGPDRKPTLMFSQIDRYSKISPEKSEALEISNSNDGTFNRSLVISAVNVRIPPKFVKEATLQEYMTAPANFEYFSQDSKVKRDLIGEIGGDLGFSRYELFYATKNKTEDGKTFRNERTSQFNGYQVQGGNSDIGLGTEHLISKTPEYRYFKTITVTIGNVDGGSTIITIAHVEVNHNQYPKDARRLAVDTATAQSQHVRAGVLEEKKERILP